MNDQSLLADRHAPRDARSNAVLAAAAAFAVLLAGCGGGDATGGASGESASGTSASGASGFGASAPRLPGGSGSADITYRPNVRVVEQRAGWDALVAVSTDGSTLVFDRSNGAIPALEVGDVLVVKGVLAKRIVAVESTGDEIAVLTAEAGLVDIVADGKIHLVAPIRFGSPRPVVASRRVVAPLQRVADLLLPAANAQAPDAERRKSYEQGAVEDQNKNLVKSAFHSVIDGWETDYSVTPEPGRLNLHIQLKRSIGNAVAVITGEGYLADFDFAADIDVEQSVVQRLELAYKKLNGVMNMKWEAQTTEGELRGDNAAIKLPAAINIPLAQYLGGLPLFVEISAAVIVKPALGAAHEISKGAFRITYDGYQNFRIKEGNVDADGNVSGEVELVKTVDNAYAATGMVVAFAAPRIELSIGISKVFKFEDAQEAAAKADKAFEFLVTKAFGADALAKLKESPLGKITPTGIVKTAMGSDAAAFLQIQTSSGSSYTGSAVFVPCTRTDLSFTVLVGANANAFGASVGDARKEIFSKKLTKVTPPNDSLCLNI